MEIVASFVVEVAKCAFDAPRRELGYLFHYNDNVENLKKQAKKLADSRDTVQKKIENAERNGEIIFADVRSWIADVDNISAKAESFLEDEVKANERCLKGWCINLGQRYRFSKEAKKHTLVISDQLHEVGKFESVPCPAPPSGIISSSKVFYSGPFESRNSIKRKAMKALIDGDSVSIIGICGMGGVGKTTLVKEISQHVKEAKMYDVVVMAVVSQTPSIMKIQGEIADMLGITSLPANSELARARFLWDRIKEKKRILVILDDVWKRIKLDEIGIPFGSDHRGCKILITSRSKTVCDEMECQEIHTVEILSKQESWALFSKIVGSNVETSDVNSIAREIAAKCGGLPIAIVTIAGALKGKNKRVWSNAARQLQKSNPSDIPGVERILFSSLELSLHYLEKVESKSLFLFCSLFPEDYKIPIEVLVRYAIGQSWFKDVNETIESVRDRVHAIVSTITSSFLLIDDGEEYVKMHDVVRDFALNIAPKYNHQFMVKAGIGLQELTHIDTFEDFTCISLMSDNTMELSNKLECPKLQVLMLQGRSEILFPENFFQGMKNLNVLDLSGFTLLSLPDSLSFLSNLRTLYISGCKLGDIGVIGKLRKLEILSLSKSSIQEISVSFSQLSNLKLLDVNDCRELTLLPSGVISSLKKLEELYINRFKEWEFESENLESNANLVELQALSRLTHLEISISNLDLSPKLLVFQNNLSNFKLRIGYNVYGDYDFLEGSSRYSRNMLVSQTNVSKIYDWVKGVLKRTECLFLGEIANLESISHNLVEEGFNELKYLDIKRCHEIKYLLNTLEWTPNSTFHNLEELHIFFNPNLIELCHGQPPAQSFNKLKVFEMKMCYNMLNVLPSNLLQSFQNLQTFTARDCESLVFIFDCKDIKIAKGETKLFSSLEYLNLANLPKLSHVWKGDHQSISLRNLKRVELWSCNKLIKLFSPTLLQSLICLEKIEISSCNNLEEIFEKKEGLDEELDHTTTSPSLGNLTFIFITDCHKLKNLFTPSIVKCLVKLKMLGLKSCSTVQEIVTNEKGEKEASIERIVFPSLYHLDLYDSENLTCFSSGSYTIEFPALESLTIYRCQKMKTFSYGEQVTPKLMNVVLDGCYEESWNGNLNATVQEYFNEQANQARGSNDEEEEEEEEEDDDIDALLDYILRTILRHPR